MGKNNSSEKRVRPTMEEIGKDGDKLKSLLDTVLLDGKPTLQNIDVKNLPEAKIHYTGAPLGEKGLRPPKDHLMAMINNPTITIKRDKFNPKTAKELIEKIYTTDKLVPKDISILEGNTFPDLFIETDSFIIIAEGKWTEQSTTTKTTFLKKRNQMTRHIQCALEYAKDKGKDVHAFYIIDDSFINLNKDIKNNYITNSVKFREIALDEQTIPLTEDEKDKILECYKGYTTWQKIESVFPDFHF